VCRADGSGNYGLGMSDGFFAEYAAVSVRVAVDMPAALRVEEAAVSADAVLAACHAVRDYHPTALYNNLGFHYRLNRCANLGS
jgi:NADPH:quinone reductase-like Zn-dependent oxidoreductase